MSMITYSRGVARLVAVAVAAAVVLISVPFAGPAGATPTGRGPTKPLAAVPGYYVALRIVRPGGDRPGQTYAPQTEALVRATGTGATIARVTPPAPYFTFTAVSGEGDDRTFVLAAQQKARLPIDVRNIPSTRFFVLRIDPSASTAKQRATLTALPITPLRKGEQVDGVAVSPDGKQLAVTITDWHAKLAFQTGLHVFWTRNGAERSWVGQAFSGYGPAAYQGSLSWAADNRTLALIGGSGSGRLDALLLDTAKRSRDLVADSRVIKVPGTNGSGSTEPPVTWRDLVITPDGATLVLVLEIVTGTKVYQQIAKVDTRTGRRLSTKNFFTGFYKQVLWSAPAGQTLVIDTPVRAGTSAAVEAGTRSTAIPWLPRTMTAAW